MAATIDPSAFDVLTFDCYGTLIDWETGLLTALRAELAGAVAGVSDEELLEAFAAVEHAAEIPYQPYRDVLAQALARLQQRYRLAPITNCDDDLFAGSAARLGVTFDEVVTAQQAGAYKPDERPFLLAFDRLGVPRQRILHVAQSLFHDHVTAKRLGLTSVWINRRAGRTGDGATPQAQAVPDLELPDLRSLADLLAG